MFLGHSSVSLTAVDSSTADACGDLYNTETMRDINYIAIKRKYVHVDELYGWLIW